MQDRIDQIDDILNEQDKDDSIDLKLDNNQIDDIEECISPTDLKRQQEEQ